MSVKSPLSKEMIQFLKAKGIVKPTPIQEKAIPLSPSAEGLSGGRSDRTCGRLAPSGCILSLASSSLNEGSNAENHVDATNDGHRGHEKHAS